MKFSLAYYGNPILRKKAVKIEAITSEIQQLAAAMFETMEFADGIGLAAPQVHHSIALFIMYIPIKEEEGEIGQKKKWVFINPKILSCSQETWKYSEGCLSIPTIYGEVERPLHITVEAMDLEGHLFQHSFSNLEARCILHENDHLNGTLFIDRIHGKNRREIDLQLKKLKKRLRGGEK